MFASETPRFRHGQGAGVKIKKLEIVGFKSFVDKTIVRFDHEVTGIVGPNGCGKSNVVDAIKWVMGEQSASRLRGKAMDDVIFNGSEARGPAGFAEVSLTFDNNDGLTPPEYRDYAEITVTRRLDRAGRSDYMINRTPVRLMDITNLFLGTGIGRRAYSIIEQGRVGYLVSSKPADRRHIIEEAAGVTKFKVRKRAAERKMDQTRQNLLRVGDVLGELEKSLASLKRQAQKAERYKRYRDEVRDLELWVASFRYLDLFTESRVVQSQLDTKSAEEEGKRLALRVREAELEGERTEVELLGRQVEEGQNKAFALDNEVRVLEGQVSQTLERLSGLREAEQRAERELGEVLGQRSTLKVEAEGIEEALRGLEMAESEAASILEQHQEELDRRRDAVADAERNVVSYRSRVGDAQQRIARADAVLAGFARRRDEARRRLENLRGERESLERQALEKKQEREELAARLEGLRSGKQQTAERRETIEAELVQLREEQKGSEARLEVLREELASKRSRLNSLEELQQRFEGVGAGVRALMTSFDGDGVLGLVADRIECPEELTNAMAGALGAALQHIVVKDTDAALAALDFLSREERGRATLMPQTPLSGGEVLRVDGEGVVGVLASLVQCAPEDRALCDLLLGRFVVVENLDVALRLREQNVAGDFVTLAGERLRGDGEVTGGAGDDANAHMLSMKREMRELETVVARLDGELSEAVQRQGELRNGIAQRQASIDSIRSEAHDAEIAIVKADKDARRLEGEAEAALERAAKMASQIEELEAAVEEAQGEESLAQEELETAKGSEQEATEELHAAEAIHAERASSVEAQAARLTEVRVRAAQAKERAESDRTALERLHRSIEQLDQREERLTGDVAEGAHQQGVLIATVLGHRERLHVAIDAAVAAHEYLGETRERYDAARSQLGEVEIELRELRGSIDKMASEVGELTLRHRELGMETDHLLSGIQERHRLYLPTILTDYHDRDLPDEQVRQRVSELLRLIERMGEINLMAIEEYDEKSERYETLKAQKTDLEDGLAKLEKAIRQMNKESKRMFQEAFVAVNERFKQLFPVLFRGGKAELRLTDPNNILETGIDIVAQPPGKKLGSLELMSGGEKALTATALIFAIFQYKPSPFCILDEVDAPLDEANISRFAQAIRQMTERSQFIVITHSKRTMEYTDVLYGVTMEQPGMSKLVSVELRGEKRPVTDGLDAAVA